MTRLSTLAEEALALDAGAKPLPELRHALQRFVDQHFRNPDKERPRISIPADERRDDDLVLSRALDELGRARTLLPELARLAVEAEGEVARLRAALEQIVAHGCCQDQSETCHQMVRARAALKEPT